jgi:hypothetical protein
MDRAYRYGAALSRNRHSLSLAIPEQLTLRLSHDPQLVLFDHRHRQGECRGNLSTHHASSRGCERSARAGQQRSFCPVSSPRPAECRSWSTARSLATRTSNVPGPASVAHRHSTVLHIGVGTARQTPCRPPRAPGGHRFHLGPFRPHQPSLAGDGSEEKRRPHQRDERCGSRAVLGTTTAERRLTPRFQTESEGRISLESEGQSNSGASLAHGPPDRAKRGDHLRLRAGFRVDVVRCSRALKTLQSCPFRDSDCFVEGAMIAP